MTKDKRFSKLRAARVIVASIVFAAFVLLFLNICGVFDKALGWLPELQFWPAVLAMNVGILVLLFALTMIFGRAYCSFLCPLGILQDGIYRVRIIGKKKRRFQQEFRPAKNWLRYSVLAIFIIAVALGHGAIAYLIEPYSIFGRMVTSFMGKSLTIGLISLATFSIIALLVWKWGRSWCNNICPVGTILGTFSRWSLFRPVIDESKCNGCGLCAKGCRASCIDSANHTIDTSRCIDCFDCIDNCSGNAISFKFQLGSFKGSKNHPSNGAEDSAKAIKVTKTAKVAKSAKGTNSTEQEQKQSKEDPQPQDNGRRAFLTASALVAGSAALKAQEGHGVLLPLAKRTEPERQVPVVPAGATSLKHFNDHCIGCQLCVEACPNGVLSPDLSLERFMQPKMDFEKGFCRPECNACSRVCPAGAIVKVTPEEKTAISIGHAVYSQELCVVAAYGISCGNCAAHCPAGAIRMVANDEVDGLKTPVVDPERCIGCGRCEYVCPSRPVSAIHIEGNLSHRSI